MKQQVNCRVSIRISVLAFHKSPTSGYVTDLGILFFSGLILVTSIEKTPVCHKEWQNWSILSSVSLSDYFEPRGFCHLPRIWKAVKGSYPSKEGQVINPPCHDFSWTREYPRSKGASAREFSPAPQCIDLVLCWHSQRRRYRWRAEVSLLAVQVCGRHAAAAEGKQANLA